MDETRKKFRICLICVVALAVMVGLFYYYSECKALKLETEGTLVQEAWTEGGKHLWL